jgi:hypothetical protein
MRTTALLVAAAMCLLIGCGGDSSDNTTGATSVQTGTTADTTAATPSASTAPRTTKQKRSGTAADIPKNKPLTQAQRDRARRQARAVATCIRGQKLRVATDPNQVQSRTLRLAKGVTLRVIVDDDSGADLYLAGTRGNYRRTARVAGKDATPLRSQRIVIVYDGGVSRADKKTIEQCVRDRG